MSVDFRSRKFCCAQPLAAFLNDIERRHDHWDRHEFSGVWPCRQAGMLPARTRRCGVAMRTRDDRDASVQRPFRTAMHHLERRMLTSQEFFAATETKSRLPQMGTLDGIRVIQLGGIGPVPFAAMLFADMGADVLRIDPPCTPAERALGANTRATFQSHPEQGGRDPGDTGRAYGSSSRRRRLRACRNHRPARERHRSLSRHIQPEPRRKHDTSHPARKIHRW